MKKLIATALAVVMIFGLVSVGFAATSELPDIEGYEFEAEVRRLASLGVIAGYPDGTFRPEDPVTRAEFAKMIVVMLGLENAANLMKGQAVSFSDVPATHWASGYINVAEMKGVVNGYPDGTFKPEGSITYAEALKMILTAMGYHEEGFVVLRWPTTWIIQAAEIGLDEDVEVLANLPISRGEVAKLFDNSLTIPHVKVGEYGFEKIEDSESKPVTFMAKLGVDEFEGIVVDSPELWSNTTGEIRVKPSTGDEKPFTTEDYEGLYGHKVKVWYKGTNVLAIEDLSTEKKLTSSQYSNLSNKPTLFFVNYTKADANVNGTVYYKDEEFKFSEADEIVVVYSGSTPIAVKAVKYTKGFVTDVNPYRSIIYVDSVRLELGNLDEVIYQGAVEKFADIKEDDLVYYIYDDDNGHAILIVVRDTYTGTLNEIMSGNKLKIDDKVFTATSDAFAKAQAENLGGTEVTVHLDKDGKVFEIERLTPEGIPLLYGIVQSASTKYVDGDPKHYAKILTADGEVEWQVASPAIDAVNKVVYKKSVASGVVALAVYPDSACNLSFVSGVVYKVDEPAAGSTVWTITVGDENGDDLVEYKFDEREVLWAEKPSAVYVQRPRPYKGDTVDLYYVPNSPGVVKVGIVK